MEIKIAVGGALGRVGRVLSQLAEEDPQTKLVASVIRPRLVQNQSQETSEYTQGLKAVTTPFDVWIDFSSVESFDEHLKLCTEGKQRMVIGLTGLSLDQKADLKKASEIIPIVYSPNMSIGMNISFKLLEVAAKVLNGDSALGVAIHEIHHRHKKDKPSGTALKMGEIIARAWGKTLPCPEIDFASSRIGEVLGEHRVLFALGNESLEITHKTENRSIYAEGALRAAKWLMLQRPGLYDMQDVLSLKD